MCCRRFCLFRKGVKSNRKTFLKSSFYVWGIASTYAIICVALNFVRNVPENVQPNICINLKFGFGNSYFTLIFIDALVKSIKFDDRANGNNTILCTMLTFFLLK